jgi:hypothetical protein
MLPAVQMTRGNEGRFPMMVASGYMFIIAANSYSNCAVGDIGLFTARITSAARLVFLPQKICVLSPLDIPASCRTADPRGLHQIRDSSASQA